MYKKLVIAGGTGFLGQLLITQLRKEYDEIVVLTRKRSIGHDSIRYVQWDAQNLGAWVEELDGADALINLTGKCVDCRYNETNKSQIMNSRVESTRVLEQAVQACIYPPRVWVNASSATIYKDEREKPQMETGGRIGNDFSETVCKNWEAEFFREKTNKVRKVAVRIGIVISNQGGAFPKIKTMVKLGIRSFGSGQQMMSWIHEEDFVRAISYVLEEDTVEGIVNLTAPTPLTNTEFLKIIGNQIGFNPYLTIQEWMLEIGAVFLKTETELILKSRWVIPDRLEKLGFKFKYLNWTAAAKQLLH